MSTLANEIAQAITDSNKEMEMNEKIEQQSLQTREENIVRFIKEYETNAEQMEILKEERKNIESYYTSNNLITKDDLKLVKKTLTFVKKDLDLETILDFINPVTRALKNDTEETQG